VNDEPAVVDCVRQKRIYIKLVNGEQRTFLDNEDVTALLRTPQINLSISAVSSYAEVRRVMVQQQRRLAEHGGVIMDGRDIGTVVLPDADLKVFMVASITERARRRLAELRQSGEQVSLQEVEDEIRRRDELDTSRSESPLKKAAADARELDTSGLSIEQQVEIIYRWAMEVIQNKSKD